MKNAGGRSVIVRCVIQNYLSDAIVVDKIVDGARLDIAKTQFFEYGLAEKKIDAAIVFNATEKQVAYYQIVENLFKLSKNIEDENYMDVAFANTIVANVADVYSETYLAFAANQIEKDGITLAMDAYHDIPDTNITLGYFD